MGTEQEERGAHSVLSGVVLAWAAGGGHGPDSRSEALATGTCLSSNSFDDTCVGSCSASLHCFVTQRLVRGRF